MNEAQFFAPWRVVAEFADDSRLTFDGFTEEPAQLWKPPRTNTATLRGGIM